MRCLGVLLPGDAIDERDECGERIVGDTLLLLLNAHDHAVSFVMPPCPAGRNWEPLLDTKARVRLEPFL